MQKFAFIFFVFVLSAISFAQEKAYPDNPYARAGTAYYSSPTKRCAERLGPAFPKLVESAKKHATLNGFLAEFKKEWAPVFKTRAFVFHSESSQAEVEGAVTWKRPRILAAAGQYIFGAIGERSKPGYEDLEVIEYLPDSGNYAFHRIRFPGKDGKQEFAVSDGASCLRCHGSTPRPHWKPYAAWPGVYGQKSGMVTGKEFEKYEEFIKETKLDARYALFKPTPVEEGGEVGTEAFAFAMARLNTCRMAQQLRQSKKFWASYKYVLSAVFRKCPDLLSFLPEKIQESHKKKLRKDYDTLEKETKTAIEKAGELRDTTISTWLEVPEKSLKIQVFDLVEPTNFAVTANLRYLVEGQDLDPKLHMSSWSTDFVVGRNTVGYSFASGNQSLVDLWFRELYFDGELDADLKGNKTCVALKAKSLAAF